MSTRVLFLDDSGKPDAAHSSRAVVLAGLAVASVDVPTLSRRILGAKAKAFPGRGAPQTWEIKSGDIIKPNPWKRAKNRRLAFEIIRILSVMGVTTYAATIDKSRMHHQMNLHQTMPLQMQCLIEHFEAECRGLGSTGIVVADWSAHHLDHNASRGVASFVASRGLSLHPSVYYASSEATQAVQVADLVAGIRRRVAEGDLALAAVDQQFQGVHALAPASIPATFRGRTFSNHIRVF